MCIRDREWKGRRKADLEHILFGDCPECGPIRDEVLQAKGKTLADVAAEVVTKAEVESKVGLEETHTGELETSHHRRGRWDWTKMAYVEV